MAPPDDSHVTAGSLVPDGGDESQPWLTLAQDYEKARAKEDSLDRLVEWPAERDLLGDVDGRSVRMDKYLGILIFKLRPRP